MSPFLGIPRELRDAIYDAAIHLETQEDAQSSDRDFSRTIKSYGRYAHMPFHHCQKRNVSCTSLVAISHQIRDEVREYLHRVKALPFTLTIHRNATCKTYTTWLRAPLPTRQFSVLRVRIVDDYRHNTPSGTVYPVMAFVKHGINFGPLNIGRPLMKIHHLVLEYPIDLESLLRRPVRNYNMPCPELWPDPSNNSVASPRQQVGRYMIHQVFQANLIQIQTSADVRSRFGKYDRLTVRFSNGVEIYERELKYGGTDPETATKEWYKWVITQCQESKERTEV